MNPYRPYRLSAVPQTLHTRLEIANAIRTLFDQDEPILLARRAEIAALRSDFDALKADIEKFAEEWPALAKAELAAVLKRYNPDEPRVPKGEHGGGRWTTESGSKAGTSAPSQVHYAANGDFPPALPGYDSNTWKRGQWPNGRYWVENPAGRKFTAHPEDDGHWRHWDVGPGDDDDYGDRWPDNSFKPRDNQKRLKENQSVTDPSGDAPPWTPNPLVPIVPEPILPADPVPTPKAPIEEVPTFPRIIIPRIFIPG
jgi:hypothetical protein